MMSSVMSLIHIHFRCVFVVVVIKLFLQFLFYPLFRVFSYKL